MTKASRDRRGPLRGPRDDASFEVVALAGVAAVRRNPQPLSARFATPFNRRGNSPHPQPLSARFAAPFNRRHCEEPVGRRGSLRSRKPWNGVTAKHPQDDAAVSGCRRQRRPEIAAARYASLAMTPVLRSSAWRMSRQFAASFNRCRRVSLHPSTDAAIRRTLQPVSARFVTPFNRRGNSPDPSTVVGACRRTLQPASLRGAQRARRQSQVAKAVDCRDCEESTARRGSLALAL